jgi:hypothetical protein
MVLAGITVLATPASATSDALPGAAITGFRAEVLPGTPMFNVELVFTVNNTVGLDCAVAANHDAELRWKLVANPGVNIVGVKKVCRAVNGVYSGVLHEARLTQSMWGGGGSFLPDQLVTALAELEPAGVDDRVDPGKPSLSILEQVGQFHTPKAPVWVGVGDGNTSAVYQESDCSLQQTATQCAAGYGTLDQPVISWVQYALDGLTSGVDLNGDGANDIPGLNIPSEWQVSYVNAATITASGASLQATGAGSQIQQLTDALDSVAPTGDRPGSWNWVGVTAGLQDSGIISALNTWYAAHPPNLSNPAVNNPWAFNTPTCPNYASVRANVESSAVKLPLQDGLLDVLDAALSRDPNLRIVHPLYPNFVDQTSPCRTAAVDAVAALNGVVGSAALQARLAARPDLSLSAAQFDRLVDLPMDAAFNDPHPTGDAAGNGSRIQLTKPWGYPYPSQDGSSHIGAAVAQLIHGEADAQPPTVEVILQAATSAGTPVPGSDWFRGPVVVKLKLIDPASATGPTTVTWQTISADGVYAGIKTPAPGSAASVGLTCSIVSGLCADEVGVPDIKIDRTPPRFTAVDQLTGAPVAVGSWFNRDVTVLWKMTDDNASAANMVAGIDPATDNVTRLVQSSIAVTAPAGKLCDLAGNCVTTASTSAQVNIEKIAPTIAAPTLTAAIGGTSAVVAGVTWYKASSVTVAWPTKPADTGGSGLVSAFDVKPTNQVITSEGLTTASPFPTPICDNAGNCLATSVAVRIDRTGPVVKLFGGPTAASQTEITNGASLPSPSVFTCTATDGTGSGVATTVANPAGCTVTRVSATTTTDGQTLVYNVTATDLAGTSTTTTFTFTGTGPVAADSVPPVVTLAGRTAGAYYLASAIPAATCAGTDPVPGSGFAQCSIQTVSTTPLGAFGPPGNVITIRATGTDVAGNTGVSASISYTVFDITPKTTGSITGKGVVLDYPSASEFTLQCSGGPNQLDLAWWIGTFDLTSVDKLYCWDDARYAEGSPDAAIDSVWLIGKGKLLNGKIGTIEVTLSDQGEPGRGRDGLSFVVKDENGAVVLRSTGKLVGGGNVQAGPSRRASSGGGYDGAGYDGHGHDHEGYGRDGYDDSGLDRDGCDRSGYDGRVKRKSAWSGYGKNGRDRDGYDRDGYDSDGYSRSGYDKKGYDEDGYDRDGLDKSGYDRNGYDENGVKRKSGTRG